VRRVGGVAKAVLPAVFAESVPRQKYRKTVGFRVFGYDFRGRAAGSAGQKLPVIAFVAGFFWVSSLQHIGALFA